MTNVNTQVFANDEFGPVVGGFQAVRPEVAAIIEAFKARKGTNRHVALTVLARNFGKAISRAKLLKAIYDTDDVANVGALGMCLEGARKSIKKDNLPFRIIKENATVALVAAQ